MSRSKFVGFWLAIAIAVTMCAGMGLAQSNTTPAPAPSPSSPPVVQGVTPGDLTPQQIKDKTQIDNFLMNHPQLAEQLNKNPSLINNPQWLSQHPDVKQYMANHPGMQSLAAKNPAWAVTKAEESAASEARNGMNETDRYFKNHPGEAKALAADPSLINNKQFMDQHPDLQRELASHPELAYQAHHNPQEFAKVAERNYQHVNAKPKPAVQHKAANSNKK